MTALFLAIGALAGGLFFGVAALDDVASRRFRDVAARGAKPTRARTQAQRWRGVDVSVVWLAIPARAGAQVLSGLPTDTLATLDATRSRAIANALRRASAEWSHAAGASYRPMSPAMAEGLVDVTTAQAAQTITAMAEPDSGAAGYRAPPASFAVVCLVVAARSEIRDFDPRRRAEIAQTLSALANVANAAFVEGHVVWTRVGLGTLERRGASLSALA